MALVAMALAPEVHRLLLESGPGAGPTSAAAAAWTALSVKHATEAAELAVVLGSAQWQGPSAQSYGAAHAGYLVWLIRTGNDYAQAAAACENAAAAYETALATMPTLVELAANHAIHAVLVVTNFFGINTIPIVLNEADYWRMWIQAATAMSIYGVDSEAAVASAPKAAPAPLLLKSVGGEAANVTATSAAAGIVVAELPGLLYGILAILYAIYQNGPAVIAAFITSVLAFLYANPWVIPLGLAIAAPLLPALVLGGAASIAVPVSVPLALAPLATGGPLASMNMAAPEGALGESGVGSGGAVRQPDGSSMVRLVDKSSATVTAGDRGAGTLGFAGTAYRESVAPPSGLTALTRGGFGGGPRVPMLPATWNPHPAGMTS